MSYLALYRKYRPDNFNSVVGQENIIKVLKNSITNSKISHAYLFYGPRGTGKTTIAKAIAKIVNCENPKDFMPCDKCKSCIAFNEKNNPDIIEIDAASNNGVDEIREIRDNVSLLPTMSKYKVYIIDEVHMLSTGAFNALLKTLEEPPKHVIFILATTEIYKVPETILSRCQTFEFKRISEKDIVKKIKEICTKEKIKIDEEVINLIAKYSDGGLRDAINMLDKLSCTGDEITIEDFYNLKGLIEIQEIEKIYNYAINREYEDLFKTINSLTNQGKNISLIAENLLIYVKNLLIEKSKKGEDCTLLYEAINIINDTVTNIKSTLYKQDFFEIGLLKLSSIYNEEEIKEEKIETKKIEEPKIEREEIKEIKEIKPAGSDIKETNIEIRINNALTLADKKILSEIKTKWKDFNDYLQDKKYSSIVSFLIDGEPRVAGEKDIIISLKYDSLVENANISAKKIEKLFSKVIGKYNLVFVSDQRWKEIKDKYIEDIKKGIKYEYKEELREEESKLERPSTEVLKEAISLFGEDMVKTK